jgi:hypothetical protein
MEPPVFSTSPIKRFLFRHWLKIALCAMLVTIYVTKPQTSADWAAWVQAIGIVGSISIAIGVVRLQNENQLATEQRARIVQQKTFLAIAQFAFEVADEAASLFAGEHGPDPMFIMEKFDGLRFKAAQEGLSHIQAVDLGTYERVNAFYRFGRAVAIIGLYAEEALKPGDPLDRNAAHGRAVIAYVKQARMEATLAIEAIRKMVDE